VLGRHLNALRSKRKTLKMNNKSATARNVYLRYDWSRVLAAAAVIALIAITAMMIMLASCTQTQRSTMSGAFATCAEGDLGTLVSPGVTLFDDVNKLIKGNAPTLEADLTGLATTFGIGIIECAITAIEAVLMAPTPPATGSGSGELVAAAKEKPPGLVRARSWVEQQHKLADAKKGSAK
jgi:hypothetical protein